MNDFLNIIDWLYTNNAQFGVDHIVVKNKVYWLDDLSDRKALYDVYKVSTSNV